MNTTILDGKKVSEELKDSLRARVQNLNKMRINPTLAIIRVGDVYASNVYVKNKHTYAKDINITTIDIIYKEEDITEDRLIERIHELNKHESIHGIIVQLPLPKEYDVNRVINAIEPSKDVDGFTNINLGKLMNNQDDAIVAATPKGIMNLLKAYNIDVAGKRCLVIGRGQTVGKPLAQLLINNDATVTVAHSKSKLLHRLIFDADIVFSCVGKHKLIREYDLSSDTIIIDAGITRNEENKLCGDFHIEFMDDVVSTNISYSPVPGGVGPMTIQALMENVIEACERIIDKKWKSK